MKITPESQKPLKVLRVAANKTDREPTRKGWSKGKLGLRDIQYMTHLRLKLHNLGHHCTLVHILAINTFSYFLL